MLPISQGIFKLEPVVNREQYKYKYLTKPEISGSNSGDTVLNS